ncbi:MAG: hypothetical protein RSA12_09870 [Clostridia bacterium]
MKRVTRSNALLMEILLVVFFFLLSATVILSLFMSVNDKSASADRLTRAVTLAENLAEQLRGSASASDFLKEEQYTVGSDAFSLKTDRGLTIMVTLSDEYKGAGTLHRAKISVWHDEARVYQLPTAWYTPDEEAS